MRGLPLIGMCGRICVVRQMSRALKVLGRDAAHGVRDPGWVQAHSGGGPRILAARDALAGEETVDDTVRASAAVGFGGLLLRCPGGAMRSVEQSPETSDFVLKQCAVRELNPQPAD